MPFPRFGLDAEGNRPLFIGETHIDHRVIARLAWKLMWIHDVVDAIYIEHFPAGVGPASASIAKVRQQMTDNGMMGGSWLGERPTLPAEIAELKHQCDRYGVRFRGWDIDYASNLERSLTSWNRKVVLKIAGDLRSIPKDVKSYIILSGKEHGNILKEHHRSWFPDLPLFDSQGDDFAEVLRFE